MFTQLLDDFILCLKEERFYDAHEALETLWYPRRSENSNEVKLLKGFINASVSFELLKRGKITSAKKVWRTYLKYRQLLYRVDSHYLNVYNTISRQIDKINREFKK